MDCVVRRRLPTSVEDAEAFEATVEGIQDQWRAALGRVRGGSAADRLIEALPGAPVVSVSTAAGLIERTFQATNQAMARLELAGIVRQVTVGRRNRAFEAPAIIDAFTALERQIASPTGDTRSAHLAQPQRDPYDGRRHKVESAPDLGYADRLRA